MRNIVQCRFSGTPLPLYWGFQFICSVLSWSIFTQLSSHTQMLMHLVAILPFEKCYSKTMVLKVNRTLESHEELLKLGIPGFSPYPASDFIGLGYGLGIGIFKGLQVAFKLCQGVEPQGQMLNCQPFYRCSFPQISLMCKMEIIRKPLQEASLCFESSIS